MGAKHDRQLVDTIARKLIALLKITHELDQRAIVVNGVPESGCAGMDVLARAVGGAVDRKVRILKSETLGRIACARFEAGIPIQDGVSVYTRSMGQLSRYASGMDVLIRIAKITIIARMWDILRDDC